MWFILVLVFSLAAGITGGCPPKVGSCTVFPADDEINRPIDEDPIDYTSDCIVSAISSWGANLRFDFGSSVTEGYGIPWTVSTAAPRVPLTYGTDGENYEDESDWFDSNGVIRSGASAGARYMPWPQNAAIEGWQGTPTTDPSGGDRHILVVDQSTCLLMESWNSVRLANGFQVSNTAIFNMSKKLPQRPDTWTSGDAAGLPIYPLLMKYSEISAGSINHAIRFTATRAQNAYSYPATHRGPSGNKNISYPYYGARFRLKASFDISAYSANSQVFLKALKKYGLIFADQGSTGYISGMSDPGFSSMIPEINNQKRVPFSAFELVQSPFPISRGWTPTGGWNAANLACKGVSANNPATYTPVWNPNCGSTPPPTAPPTGPPTAPPVAPPRAPPVAPPTAPPVAPPIAPPRAPPVAPPTTPPTAPPIAPPVAPPVAPPTTPPRPPVAPPTATPVFVPRARVCTTWATGTMTGYDVKAATPSNCVYDYCGFNTTSLNNIPIVSILSRNWTNNKYRVIEVNNNGNIQALQAWDQCSTTSCASQATRYPPGDYLLRVERRTLSRLFSLTNYQTLARKVTFRVCEPFDVARTVATWKLTNRNNGNRLDEETQDSSSGSLQGWGWGLIAVGIVLVALVVVALVLLFQVGRKAQGMHSERV